MSDTPEKHLRLVQGDQLVDLATYRAARRTVDEEAGPLSHRLNEIDARRLGPERLAGEVLALIDVIENGESEEDTHGYDPIQEQDPQMFALLDGLKTPAYWITSGKSVEDFVSDEERLLDKEAGEEFRRDRSLIIYDGLSLLGLAIQHFRESGDKQADTASRVKFMTKYCKSPAWNDDEIRRYTRDAIDHVDWALRLSGGDEADELGILDYMKSLYLGENGADLPGGASEYEITAAIRHAWSQWPFESAGQSDDGPHLRLISDSE